MNLFSTRDDIRVGEERLAYGEFSKRYTNYRLTDINTKTKVIPDNATLPQGSILHLLDNFPLFSLNEKTRDISDTPDLTNKFITADTYRKYFYTQEDVDVSSVIQLSKDYVYRPIGLIRNLTKFKAEKAREGFIFTTNLGMITSPGTFLGIVNHNPLFRIFTRGTMAYYRAFRTVFASILNNCIACKNKNNFIMIPLVDKIYPKGKFVPAERQISASTLFDKTVYQYLFFVELFNFISYTCKIEDNIFKQIPEDALPSINFVFEYYKTKDRFIWNLANLLEFNKKNAAYNRILNQFNSFILKGMAEDKKKELELAEVSEYREDTTEADDKVSKTISREYTKLTGEVLDESTDETITGESTVSKDGNIKDTIDVVTKDDEEETERLIRNVSINDNININTVVKNDEVELDEIADAIITPDEDAPLLETIEEKAKEAAEPVDTKIAANLPIMYTDKNINEIEKPVKEWTYANTPQDVHALGVSFLNDIDEAVKSNIDKNTRFTPAQKARAVKLSSAYKTTVFNGKTIEKWITEYKDPKVEDNEITTLKGKLPDESMLKSSMTSMDDSYMKNLFTQQMLTSLLSLNKQGMYLQSVNEEKVVNELNQVLEYTAKYVTADGKQATIKYSYPVVREDGTTLVNGIVGFLKKQMCNIPICKVSATRVSLASSYNKTIVEKKSSVARSFMTYFNKLVRTIDETRPSKMITTLGTTTFDKNDVYPFEYTEIATTYKSFTVKDEEHQSVSNFYFIDKKDRFIPSDDEVRMTPDKKYALDISRIEFIEKRYNWLFIGQMVSGTSDYTNSYYFMDMGSRVHVVAKFTSDPKIKPLGDWHFVTCMTDLLAKAYRVKPSTQLVEWVEIKILDKKFPVAFLLCYRFGLLATLRSINAKYEIVGKRSAPKSSDLQSPTTTITIPFKDNNLVISRYPLKVSYIVAGLLMFNTKDYLLEDFEFKDVYNSLLLDKKSSGYKITYLKGIDDTFDLFIDGDTYFQLKQMHEPTEFGPLLVRATEMLVIPTHKEAASISNHRVRTYGRMNNILYNEIARGYANYTKQKGSGAVFSINPNAIMGRIIQDQAMQNYEAINPIHDIKSTTGITFVGAGGRTQESFVTADRRFPEDGLGFFSEAVPDSGNVGIVAQCSINPTVANTFGLIKETKDIHALTPTELLSGTGLLMPGITNDDPKRGNFVSIQMTHTVPTIEHDNLRIRTGFEKVIAHRCNNLFAYTAKQDGVVLDIDENLKTVKIKYKDDTVKVFSYATQFGECPDIVTTQKQVITVKKGDKFKKDEVLRYNPEFFTVDPDDARQVDYSLGVTGTVAFVDTASTFEDSNVVTRKFADRLGIEPIVLRNVPIPINSEIHDFKFVGSKVEVTDPLIVFEMTEATDISNMDLDEASMNYLEKLNRQSPKAKYSGEIVKIRVFYGEPLDTMSVSLSNTIKKVVKNQNALAKYAKGSENDYDFTESSILPKETKYKGTALEAGQIIFQFFIKEYTEQNAGDKIVIDSSLKTTTSVVRDHIAKGAITGENIDVLFSASSLSNRIVLSPLIVGISEKVLSKMEDDIVDMYLGGSNKPLIKGLNNNIDIPIEEEDSNEVSNTVNVKHLEDLDALHLDVDDYIIGASAAAIVAGMPIENQDIDICIRSGDKVNKLLQSRMIVPGEKDGVHDNMYQDRTGNIDIALDNETTWFKYDDYIAFTVVVDGHRYLNVDGLIKFYSYLYNLYGKEKHKTRLDWLLDNYKK